MPENLPKSTLQTTENTPIVSSNKLIIKTVIITVLAVFVFSGIVYAGFYFGRNRNSKNINKQATNVPTPIASIVKIASPSAKLTNDVPYGDENLDTDTAYQKAMNEYNDEGPYGWKQFTTKDGKYSLKYPPDWILEDKSEYIDLYNDGNKQFSQEVLIYKDNYSFNSKNPLAWGPSICLYPDSPAYEGLGQDNIIQKFIEIKGVNAVYRRPEVSDYPYPPGKLRWWLCQKESSGNFTSVAGFGQIWYDTPKEYDPLMLILMDQITASFTKK